MGRRAAADIQQLPLFDSPASATSTADQSPGPATRTRDDAPSRVGAAGVTYIASASVLSPASGFMSAYKFTLNPYSGCSFGCEYCYARFFAPSLEEQESWGMWVKVKENAVDLIRRARRSKSAERRLESNDAIYMSSVTDPYQPIEQKLRLTRAILEELVDVQPRLIPIPRD